MPAEKMTPSMRRVLENIVAGRPATHGFAGGRSTSGGLSGTFVALHRRGWISQTEAITEAGRAALAGKTPA